MSLYPGSNNNGGERDRRGGGGSQSPSGSSLSEAQAKRDTANEKLMVCESSQLSIGHEIELLGLVSVSESKILHSLSATKPNS